jgi:hypothetical protein
LLLNIRGWRRWAGDRDIWRGTTEEDSSNAIEEEEYGVHVSETYVDGGLTHNKDPLPAQDNWQICVECSREDVCDRL